MREYILSIQRYECNFDDTFSDEEYPRFEREDGYIVRTNLQEIRLMINNYQKCCETWGYFFCNEDHRDFLGAVLHELTITDTELNTRLMNEYGYYGGGVMFVNLQTDRGILQFVAYNQHNGYYGHYASVRSNTLNHSVEL